MAGLADYKSARWLRWERKTRAKVLRGSDRAARALFEAFAPDLYHQVLLPRLRDEAAADDALAETFRTAWAGLERYEDRGMSMYFWLARIASTKAADELRARARHERNQERLRAMQASDRALAERPDAGFEWVERAMDSPALARQIREVLDAIHPRYGEALERRYLQGQSRVECAAAMDVKVGTFDVVLLRASRAFRARWEETHDS